MTGDTFGMYGGDIDFSQPLTSDKTWAARLVADARDDPTFVKSAREKFANLSLTVQGQLRPDTTITLLYERLENDIQQQYGVPLFSLPQFHYAHEDNVNISPYSPERDKSDRLQVELDHQFSPDWTWRTVAQFNRSTNYNRGFYTNFNSDGSGSTYSERDDFARSGYAFDSDINGHFRVLGLPNNLTAGLTYTYVSTTADDISSNGPLINGSFSSPFTVPVPQIDPQPDVLLDYHSHYYQDYGSVY